MCSCLSNGIDSPTLSNSHVHGTVQLLVTDTDSDSESPPWYEIVVSLIIAHISTLQINVHTWISQSYCLSYLCPKGLICRCCDVPFWVTVSCYRVLLINLTTSAVSCIEHYASHMTFTVNGYLWLLILVYNIRIYFSHMFFSIINNQLLTVSLKNYTK